MKTSTSYNPNAHLALLLAGPPGSGKTTLAMQFPGVYIADCDNNMSGPARRMPDAKFLYDTINLDDNGKEVPPNLRWKRLADCLLAANQHPDVQTIVVDSLTAVVDYAIDDIKRQQNIKSTDPLRRQDWGVFMHYIKTLMTSLRSTGKHVIVTAHNLMEQDDADQTFKLFLNVPGKTKDNIAGFFSDVWSCYVEQQGVGATKKYVRIVETAPKNANDQRGIKGSFLIDSKVDQDTAIKTIHNLLCK
jgi:DNA polymerase III delta prime subunit